jgi:hypothetical protein
MPRVALQRLKGREDTLSLVVRLGSGQRLGSPRATLLCSSAAQRRPLKEVRQAWPVLHKSVCQRGGRQPVHSLIS